MTAFPTHDSQALADLAAQSAAIFEIFSGAGFSRVEPPILQPADVFLDRSGEEIRRRTYVFTDPGGEELCLRPDLTIPTLRAFLAGAPKPGDLARWCYEGPVFRYQLQSPGKPAQFLQAGCEILGAGGPSDDAEIMALCLRALERCGLRAPRAKMGDLALFAALVDALDLPPPVAARLKRRFWRPDAIGALLRQDGAAREGALMRTLGGMDAKDARQLLQEIFAVAGIKQTGARSPDEIAERFLEKAAGEAAARLPAAAAALLARFLEIEDAAPAALEAVETLTADAGVSIAPHVTALRRRLTLLEGLGVDPQSVRFAAQFGRNMEYYTGFVFELWSQDAHGAVQIAGGGRYDRLAQDLGAPFPVPAAGCAIRTERLRNALRAQRSGQ
jgi:ATP phosphoribosyltransferase regulatory subunit